MLDILDALYVGIQIFFLLSALKSSQFTLNVYSQRFAPVRVCACLVYEVCLLNALCLNAQSAVNQHFQVMLNVNKQSNITSVKLGITIIIPRKLIESGFYIMFTICRYL